MCGRFAFHLNARQLRDLAGLRLVETPPARYNISPGTAVGAVLRPGQWSAAHWGFPTPSGLVINARSETAAERPLFKRHLSAGRCLVPVSGYFEWQKTPDGRQPYYFYPESGEGLLLAGLWRPSAEDPSGEARAGELVLLTRAADGAPAAIHHRMPLCIPPAERDAWLDPGESPDPWIRREAFPDELRLSQHPVGRRVNRAGVDDRELLREAKLPQTPRQLDFFGDY